MNYKELRIVFMGTPEYAVPTLKKLVEEGYNVVACITQTDKKRGRGKKVSFCEVKCYALSKGIEVLQPKSLKTDEFYEKVLTYLPDLFVTIAYGKIIPKRVLDIPKYGCINVHASLLPQYRGAAPIWWSVINGDKKTGITTMYSDEGIDTGDVLLKKEFAIDDEMTTGTLHDELSKLSASVLMETFKGLEDGSIKPIKQNDENATYARMINREDGKIDFNKTCYEIKNLVRGTNPWPGAYAHYEGVVMKVFDVKVIDEEHNVVPGTILKVTKNEIIVACKEGKISLIELQMPCCRKMKASQYLCGHEIKEGVVLL